LSFTRTWQTNQKALYWQTFDGIFESWYSFTSLKMFEEGLDANAPLAARIYAMMSVAHADATIACWHAKYTYWFWRPQQMEAELTTLFPTPDYPSYPSGHACISTAISEVIAHHFPASGETMRARVSEALESRIWAGIHFRHELVAGKAIGLAVAQKVTEWAE
jgi:membrane-associated phospholipid phosphatase